MFSSGSVKLFPLIVFIVRFLSVCLSLSFDAVFFVFFFFFENQAINYSVIVFAIKKNKVKIFL